MGDFREELEAFDGTFPEGWKPKVGDVLVGKILRYDKGWTDYGECPICLVEDEEAEGPRAVWIFHTVLVSEFEKKRPKVGERIGIKRLPDAAKGYRRYALRIDREEPDVLDFSRFGRPNDVPARGGAASGGSQGDDHSEFTDEALAGEDDLPF